MYEFAYHCPDNLAEAITLLDDDEAMPLAGGQTLIPTLKQRLASPSVLVSLAKITELHGIQTTDKDVVSIGATTTHREVAEGAATAYPALAALAGRIGDAAVRNRGTIGGSLANNDPSACYPAAVLASGATIITNQREIAAEDYFQGLFDTALAEGEIITHVQFPIPICANYQKFEQPASRFALCGVFVAQYANMVRVAITGASENGVFRWQEAEAALNADFSPEALSQLSLSSDEMISDIHGTGAYRAHLCKVLTMRAVTEAME